MNQNFLVKFTRILVEITRILIDIILIKIRILNFTKYIVLEFQLSHLKF